MTDGRAAARSLYRRAPPHATAAVLAAPRTTMVMLLAMRCATAFVLPAEPLQAQVSSRGAVSDPRGQRHVLPRLTPVAAPGAVDHASAVYGEAAWLSIPPLPLIVREPVYGPAPTERTDIRVAHTDDMLYVRAVLYDREPSQVRANSLYRDRLSGDDVVGVLIDARDDHENALWFWTTPAGVRGDAAILGDGRSTNIAWNGFWDVDVTQSDSGWTAALRIPLATIGARIVRDTMTLGLTVYRYIARRNEVQMYPAIPPAWDYLRPSRAQRVSLAGVRWRRHVYVTPWVLGGVMPDVLSEDAAQPARFTRNAGVDLNYGIAPGMSLDITVNTDFAQVEADDEQVNLTRFPLSFPERRRFFQESAGVFEFVTGDDDRLFYSRRIGLADGAPIPIAAGARLSGRVGEWDIGLLQMQTRAAHGTTAHNFGVLRLRRQLLNPQSYSGMMVTTRLGANGERNAALGADAVLQISGDDYLTLRAAHTSDRPADAQAAGGTDPDAPFDAAVGRIIWERRRSAGARYAATAGWTGSRYLPGAGFVARTGVTDAAAAVAYTWFPARAGNVARIDPLQFSTEILIRHEDDVMESASLEYNFDIAWRSGIQASADVELQFEDVPAFELPNGTQVNAGRYTFATLEAGIESSSGGRARGEVDAVLGTFYDGWRGGLESRLNWNASRHFELSLEHEFNAVRLPVRAQGFDSHVLRLRAGVARDTRASATVFAQYASVSGARGINLRLRYNFTEGHDLWLVLDEGLEGSPGAAARHTLIIKYARTLIW